MDPRFTTKPTRQPLRYRLAEINAGPLRNLRHGLARRQKALFWWSYWITAFLMFGYQMNRFVGTDPTGQPLLAMTVIGSLISAVFWPLLLVTWLFS